MGRGNQRELRCSNSWRPSDGPLSPQSGPPQRRQLPVQLERLDRFSIVHAPQPDTQQYSNIDQRPTPRSTHAIPEPPIHTFKNPNLMPVAPRRSQLAQSSLPTEESGQYEKIEEERLPQVWHPSIDDLIRRTAHDYDLIMNYERDAEGGQRWLAADIAHIRNVGKNLHRDIFALRRWQRVVAQQGDQDKIMMMHVKREANFVKLLCERVQSAIAKHEQKCNLELLRDGAYAQDEDGNLYKPTTPEEFGAEGGYLHNVPLSSNEASWYRDQEYRQDQNSDYGCAATFGSPRDTEPSLASNRNPAFDFAFQSTPFDTLEREALQQVSQQSTPTRSSRSANDKISKLYPDPSRSKHCSSDYCSFSSQTCE
jgi:hypothetical protein